MGDADRGLGGAGAAVGGLGAVGLIVARACSHEAGLVGEVARVGRVAAEGGAAVHVASTADDLVRAGARGAEGLDVAGAAVHPADDALELVGHAADAVDVGSTAVDLGSNVLDVVAPGGDEGRWLGEPASLAALDTLLPGPRGQTVGFVARLRGTTLHVGVDAVDLPTLDARCAAAGLTCWVYLGPPDAPAAAAFDAWADTPGDHPVAPASFAVRTVGAGTGR